MATPEARRATSNDTENVTDLNKAIVRRLYAEAVNDGDPAAVEELVAPTFAVHSDGTDDVDPVVGHEAFRAPARLLKGAIPDLRFHVQELVAEGDLVVARWTSQGTHTGELFGRPATGRPVGHWGIIVYRLAGGQVVEMWPMVDRLGLLQQMGVIDPLPRS